MNIFETIKHETAAFAGKPAVIEDADSITYGQLIISAELIASSLKQNGAAPFHRIGLLCGDSIDYITVSLAILSLSAVVVPISTDHTKDEISDILNKISVDLLVFEKGSHSNEGAFSLVSKGFCKKEFYIKKGPLRKNPVMNITGLIPRLYALAQGLPAQAKELSCHMRPSLTGLTPQIKA